MERKQYVIMENIKSDELELTRGVPQASPFGLLVFCFFTNGLPDILLCSEPYISAEDLKIVFACKKREETQEDLN